LKEAGPETTPRGIAEPFTTPYTTNPFMTMRPLIVLSLVLGTASVSAAQEPVSPAAADGSAPTILFVGTSLTAGYGLAPGESFPARIQEKLDSLDLGYTVVNAGVAGEPSAAARARMSSLLDEPFDVLVLETGAQDMLRRTAPESIRADIEAIIAQVREARPHTRVVLLGMMAPPFFDREYAERFHALYTDIAREYELPIVPFLLLGVGGIPSLNLADGFHPNADGQRVVARNVWEVLAPVLGVREVGAGIPTHEPERRAQPPLTRIHDVRNHGPVPLAAARAPGAVSGYVQDEVTGRPVAGATVSVDGTDLGVLTDEAGRFRIGSVPTGAWVLIVQRLGYRPLRLTDVVVHANRTTTTSVSLQESAVELEGITVQPRSFQVRQDEPTGRISLSGEEVRRAPGLGIDVSRLLTALPAMAHVGDDRNDLLVRGGSSMENGFLIDNIPVPFINHFSSHGVSGGPIGIVRTDFVREVSTSVGGFSAVHGDRLSSITEIQYRQGNPDRLATELSLSMAGVALAGEGPLGSTGSWLAAVNRSYLDLLVDAIGTGVAPRYSDAQLKGTWDAAVGHRLSFLHFSGQSRIEHGRDQVEGEDWQPYWGSHASWHQTTGINWQALWGQSVFSQTSFSVSDRSGREGVWHTADDARFYEEDSHEQSVAIRSVTTVRYSPRHRVDLGFDGAYVRSRLDFAFGADRWDGGRGELRIADHLNAVKTGVFYSHVWSPVPRWSATFGVRGDHYSANGKFDLSPRFATSFQADERTRLSAAAGVYHQTLPLFFLAQDEANRELRNPRAVHLIAGLERMLGEDTRATLELYTKEYDRFPLSHDSPKRWMVDEPLSGNGLRLGALTDEGRAWTRGTELTLQRKATDRIHGLFGASFFRSRYQDLEGEWRDRIHDNRVTVQAIVGYRTGRSWELGARWAYGGGVPYTPADLDRSREENRLVPDESRFHAERLPAYHSLSLRADRSFRIGRSTLVQYLSVSNAYARPNIRMYTWNGAKGEIEPAYQFGFLPVLGFDWKF
jgi:lysophospholipase L1-like esterase